MKRIMFYTALFSALVLSYNSARNIAFAEEDITSFSTKIIKYEITKEDEAIVSSVKADPVESFVSRLYLNFLGRQADVSGLASWTNALKNKKATGAKVVYGFVYSQEFQNNPLSNEAFVTAMYNTIFDRNPDTSGLRSWVTVLENGCTRKKVLSGFLNSDEMKELCRSLGIESGSYHSDEIIDEYTQVTYFVSRMYRYCLNREADYSGLTSWVKALVDGSATGRKIAEGFFGSTEMKNRNLSNKDYVTVAYQALLDREPDSNGLQSWTNALVQNGDRKKIVNGFIKSQEFIDLCAKYGIRAEDTKTLFINYLKTELMAKYGLASLSYQEATISYDSRDWLRCSGIISAYIKDLDNDEEEEMMVFFLKKSTRSYNLNRDGSYDLCIAVYGIIDGTPQMLDESVLLPYYDYSYQINGLYWLENTSFLDTNVWISSITMDNKTTITVEYSDAASVFADGGYCAFWSICFENGRLYVTSSFIENGSSSDRESFYGYSLDHGRVKTKTHYTNGEKGLQSFWSNQGIRTKSNLDFYDLPSQAVSIFPESEIDDRILTYSIRAKGLGNDWRKARIRFEINDFTNIRSNL